MVPSLMLYVAPGASRSLHYGHFHYLAYLWTASFAPAQRISLRRVAVLGWPRLYVVRVAHLASDFGRDVADDDSRHVTFAASEVVAVEV